MQGDNVICEHCQQSIHKKVYNQHLITNHPTAVTTVQCSQCEKTFVSEKYLEKHKEFVHGISSKPNFCQKCHRGYVKNHVCTEKSGQGEQNCEYCGKTFNWKTSLNEHINKVHKNNNPFKCEHCSQAFPSKHRLVDHTVNHHEPIFCDLCHKTISNKWEFRKHEVFVHKKINKDTHICDLCPKGKNLFFSTQVYLRHCEKKHSASPNTNNTNNAVAMEMD